jgi:Skp family chaperone for outer membrane proteins
MKLLSLLLSLFAILVGTQGALAEDIAIVDTQRVLTESIIGKAAKSNLEGRIKKAQAKMTQAQADFERQRADLAKQSAILSGSALEAKQEALQKKQVELRRMAQDAQEELAKANEEEISKVVAQIAEVVQEVASEKGFRFVFEKDRRTVLYSSDRIDISSDVVKILDKKKVAL